jgi:enoyl-CoA hydratase/carnithine racemase
MAYEFLSYEKRGRIAYITIKRPERMNALHPPANAEMLAAFTEFRDDPEAWIAILTGTGERAFSAGNDLRYTAEQDQDRDRPASAAGRAPFGGITSGFECWKPMIAAVNGFALGGGLELAMSCDVIVAADHAEVGLPEPRVGLYAGAGGVHRLPRHIPHKLAMGMMLTGRRIKAQEALKMGLVNEVVPLAELMPTADRWAAEMLECAPLSLRASKQMALQGLDWPLEIAHSRTYSEAQRQVASADRIEGPRAFAEKRTPIWKGA